LTQAFGPLGATQVWINDVSFDMVKLPPGRFVDGEGATRRERLVSRPFELGVTLVTQPLWRAVMGSRPSQFTGEDQPVEQVSWEDVQRFLVELFDLGFPGFRLPTEAEWVWAARCGVPTRWSGADRVKSVAVANMMTRPVASLLPAASGLFDVSGNLWEWQQDALSQAPAPGVDTQGPSRGSSRVYRGGAWNTIPSSAQVNYRAGCRPTMRTGSLGFRLLRASS